MKAILRASHIRGTKKQPAVVSSDGGFIIVPPGDWCGIYSDDCKNMTIIGFHIIVCKGEFKYRLIQKILGVIGWKELLFGGKETPGHDIPL